MLEGNSVPFNMVANKMSPLNAFPLKFRVYNKFGVLCQILASARFQLIV